MKKIIALLIAMMLVLSMGVAFAEGGEGGETPATTTSGSVGGTGSITVLNATKGQDYKAYKIFDASYDGDNVSYKVLASLKDNVDTDYFTISSVAETINGQQYYTVSRKVDTDGNQVKTDAEIIDWVKSNYDKFGSTGVDGTWDTTNSTVTFNNIPYGYYYITSTLGTTVTIDSAKPTQNVYDKNETNPVDPVKTIVSIDGTAQKEVTEANAHVGSVVGFKVTAKTTNWSGKEEAAVIRKQWTMTDTPTNMTIDPTTVVVKFNGTELATSAYTAEISGGSLTITVPMTDTNGNSVYEATQANNGVIPIEITYSATIVATAGDASAKNEIPGDNPPPPVIINTYAFQIAKTDDKTQPLPGAQFQLLKDGTPLTFIDNKDGTYTYSTTGTTVTTLDMTTNTTIVVKGLDTAWTYTLKEITVPEGYNQAEDKEVAGSSLTKIKTVTYDPATGKTTTTEIDTTPTSTALHKETVVNKAGAVLPSTGGIGTTIFYIAGSILVLAAAVLLITKRRMGHND